jgi:hypothetical protein
MTDLQIALVLAGALCVALVWGSNLIQEREQRRRAEELFRARHPDALMNDVVPELSLNPEPEEPLFISRENEVKHVAATAARIEPQQVPAPPVSLADPVIDWMLRIRFVESVSAPALWAAQAAWAETVKKSITWIVYTEEERGQWLVLNASEGGRYKWAIASLQLVDRNGPVTEDQVCAFLAGIKSITQQHYGEVDFPDESALIARADLLDDLCVAVDVQVIIKVILRTGALPDSGVLETYIDLMNFKPGDSGTLYAVDESGALLFSVSGAADLAAPRAGASGLDAPALRFSLDVPRVAKGALAFDRMLAAAKRASSLLGGMITDNRNHQLSESMAAGIRTRIQELQERMAVSDILPGSERALRLFR